ncbi:MAG: hypothetical protein IID32_08920, partial [Planctomycetes bacterium]|nr:hypothetical protein [Planctomycetota bacterium]
MSTIPKQDLKCLTTRDINQPLPKNASFHMDRFNSFDQVCHIRDQWDDFVEQLGGDLFSSFNWCATWWKHFGKTRELQIHIATVENDIVAILPLFRETLRWGPVPLRLVRIVGSGYFSTKTDFLVKPQWIPQVTIALVENLSKDAKWDMIYFGDLPTQFSHGLVIGEALQCCKSVGHVVLDVKKYPNMTFDLPCDYGDYLNTLSRKERRNVRR